MTARRQRKNKKYKGSQTCGGGSRKKRRGAGNRGGRGRAGTGKRAKHKKFTILKKYGLAYFGKYGFTRPQGVVRVDRAVNVGDLPRKPTTLNLSDFGYTKLLGHGVAREKYTITVDSCSQRAKEKIESAGGKVVTKRVVESLE